MMKNLIKMDSFLRRILWRIISKIFSERVCISLLDFDVFNRHNIIVKKIIDNNLCNGLILDVGGRVHSLSKFLPLKSGGRIFVLNPEKQDLIGPANTNVFAVQGDGASLPFADNTFDAVTSITTLEHVDKGSRTNHFLELLRVCKRKVLIYVPIGPEGEIYERKLYQWSLNDHIKFMTKQHIDNGLPTLKEMRKSLPGCAIIPVQNANVWLYCMLLKQVPLLGIILPSLLYSLFRHVKVKPYYEYLIEFSKEDADTVTAKRKTILIVSKCLPRFDRGSGHVRMFAIIKLLLKYYNVKFIAESFSHSAEINDNKYKRTLEEMGVEVYRDNFKWKSIKKIHFDLAILSWYQTALQRLPVIRRKFPAIPVIIDSVDVHFARELQMAQIHQDKAMLGKALRTKKVELEVYRKADQIWTVTDADKQILLENDPDLDIHIIPNIHEFESVDRSNVEPNSLLFIGNFLHSPNVDAMLYFCESILPNIQREIPEVLLYIVGNAPTEEIRALASNSIKVTGWVPDIKPYLEKCHVSIVPLRYGAGLKGKVGEAMMAGIPVVTTPVGIQGMDVEDGTHLLLRTSDEDFAAAVISLLNDNGLCAMLSENGMKYIRQRFTPAEVEKEIEISLHELLR